MTTQPNTKCTCPSGDGSLRWPCPKHPPAAAQEAVAYWRVTFRMYPENSDCCETFVRGPDRPTLDTLGISPRPVQITSMEPYFAAPVTAAPAEMSPEFTDTARAAIAWVLWHHQGASSPVGLPLRFALGMGAYEPLPDWRIAEAKRYAAWAGATTAKFHEARAITPAAPGIDLAADYDGMRVDHSGLFKQVRAALRDEPGLAEMVRQLHGHLVALGRRWYAGDKKVVDELLQLYCIEPDARRALIDASPKDELESWKRGTKACAEVLGQVMRQTQDSPKGGSEARAPLGLKLPNLPFAVFDEFGVGADDRIADYGLACAKAAMQAASAQAQAGDAPTYTTGHCENHKKPGGCPLHNLQCGYPRCDRRQAGDAEVQP